ncbi:MAG: hypothetical protein ACOX1L_05135 [Erysipelotrichaceae bacterium]|jgi:hypothetical protein
MIRRGKEEDKRAIFDLYTKSGVLNFESQDEYFINDFIPENVLVNDVNGSVVASMQTNYHPMILHDKRLSASVVFGHFYDRSKGIRYYDALKDEAFEHQKYRTLVTIVPTKNPAEYERYGFEPIYNQRLYTISRSHLKNSSYSGVSRSFKIKDLVAVYEAFIVNFNGYLLRDYNYYMNLIDLLQIKRYNLVAFYDEQSVCKGYMIYYIESSKIVVEEIIYLDGLALTRLLCYVLRRKKSIQVYVSEHEDLTKAYPSVSYKSVNRYVARINDFELFNKLYESNITTTAEGFNLLNKALYINDLNY